MSRLIGMSELPSFFLQVTSKDLNAVRCAEQARSLRNEKTPTTHAMHSIVDWLTLASSNSYDSSVQTWQARKSVGDAARRGEERSRSFGSKSGTAELRDRGEVFRSGSVNATYFGCYDMKVRCEIV